MRKRIARSPQLCSACPAIIPPGCRYYVDGIIKNCVACACKAGVA